MKNIVGYIRVSTGNQDLERQKALIKEFADLYDCTVVEYVSESISGTTSKRDGYNKLLTLNKEYADTVVMTEVSRFSREKDVINPLMQVNNIIHNGLTIVFMDNDPHKTVTYKDTLTPEQINKLVNGFADAANERDKIVGRMTTGRRTKFKQFPNGCWGRPPFGYKRVINPDYKMTQNPRSFKERDENAPVVAQMFQWIIDGHSLKDVALRLQAKGIRTAPTNKYPEGNDFDDSIVASIIHNPIYKGEWTLGGNTIYWDGIVSEDTWNKAQDALKKNRMFTIIRDVNYNPLKGIMKCPCGRSMYIVNDRKYIRYRCAVKKDKYDTAVCNNGGTGYNIVLKCVWNAVMCSAKDIQFANETTKEIDRLKNKITWIDADIESRKTLIKENQANLDKIAASLFKFSASMIEKISQESAKIEETISKFKEEIKSLTAKKNAYLDNIKMLEQKNVIDENFSIEQKAEIFQQLLESVVYYDVAMHKGFIEIVFKNGMKMLYMVLAARKLFIKLPMTFVLNKENRKVQVELFKTSGFSFNSEIKEYDIDQLLNVFPEIMTEKI